MNTEDAMKKRLKRNAQISEQTEGRIFTSENEEAMKIILNGREVLVGETSRLTLGDPDAHLSYEAVVKLAGHDPSRILTVTYRTRRQGDAQRQGSLIPGQTTKVEDGMVFDVADTSRA